MNLATLIGLVLGIVLIGYASMLSASTAGLGLGALWDLVSLLIVVGGALAATAVAFKLSEVLSIIKSMGRIFADDAYTMKDVVVDFISLSESQRKGELGKALEGVPESMPFRLKVVSIGCQYVADGYKKEDIRDILENMEEYRAIREGQQANVMKTLGVYTPAFGMVGTLIGLVFMLGGMALPPEPGVDPAAKLGGSMAVALITTLYGALFSNFIFLPFADKLKGKSEGKKVESAMILEGVMLIFDKTHPMLVRDKLNAFLDSPDRIKEEE
jgi:chemotaxis protein MotA